MLAVRDVKIALKPLLREVRARERNRRRRHIDAGDDRPAFGKPRQVDTGPAAHFENRFASAAVKRDEPQQVMELFEMILIEIVEEAARADRLAADLEIVNVLVPVRADLVDGGHGSNYSRWQ